MTNVEEYFGHVIEIGQTSFWAHITKVSDREAYEAEFYLSVIPENQRADLLPGTRFRWYIERNDSNHELHNHFELDYSAPLTEEAIAQARSKAVNMLAHFKQLGEEHDS